MNHAGKLSLDIPGSISALEDAMKYFEIKRKEYRIFRGKGLEFEGYRNYSPDEDDASFIDWKASARANKTLVKQYKEETNLKVIFMIDVGSRMVFGSTPKVKCEYIAELAAAFSHVILTSGDKIGFILFNDKVVQFVPPSGGMNQFQRFVSILEDGANYGGRSDLNQALTYAEKTLDRSISAVVIISDFLNVPDDLGNRLKRIDTRFETMALIVKDPLDMTLPNISREVVLQDPYSGEQILVNPSLAKKQYELYSKNQEKKVLNMLQKAGIDALNMSTSQEFAFPLAQFLSERLKRGFAAI